MSHTKIDAKKILSDKRVVEEIRRHLWIESEKAGYDIGFEKAKQDWLENFSKAWMSYHMPATLAAFRKTASPKSSLKKTGIKKSNANKPAGIKRRRAKSYLK